MQEKLTTNTSEPYASHTPALVTLIKLDWGCAGFRFLLDGLLSRLPSAAAPSFRLGKSENLWKNNGLFRASPTEGAPWPGIASLRFSQVVGYTARNTATTLSAPSGGVAQPWWLFYARLFFRFRAGGAGC